VLVIDWAPPNVSVKLVFGGDSAERMKHVLLVTFILPTNWYYTNFFLLVS